MRPLSLLLFILPLNQNILWFLFLIILEERREFWLWSQKVWVQTLLRIYSRAQLGPSALSCFGEHRGGLVCVWGVGAGRKDRLWHRTLSAWRVSEWVSHQTERFSPLLFRDLEIVKDRWATTAHGVAKSQTQRSDWTTPKQPNTTRVTLPAATPDCSRSSTH